MDQATILRGKPGRIMLAGAAFLLLVAMPYLLDRKSTRLNSSHLVISYAVFCLKKKNKIDFDLAGRSADPRIVVAMSGGVASSVTTALLLERGCADLGLSLTLSAHVSAMSNNDA